MSAEDLARKGIYLPPSVFVERETRYVCNFPGCDAEFYEGEERQRTAHALMHARVHDSELMELATTPSEELMGEGDVEYERYLKQRHAQTGSLNPRDY